MRLLPARESWPSGWRVYAAAAAALLAVVVAVVLVVPGGGSTDELIAEGPTPTPTASDEATSTPTAAPAPSASASEAPDPTATPDSSSSAASAPRLDTDHLLSEAFVDRAFGGGANGRTEDWTGGYGSPLACWPTYDKPEWEVPATRTWMWPGEVVVGETLARLSSLGDARERLADCRRTGPSWQPTGAATRTLDVGDEAYVAVDSEELYTQLHAGARIGRDLVLLQWRQPGRVSDTAPLEHALRAAVERVLGRAEPAALAAPPPQASDAFEGFLTSDQVRAAAGETRWSGQTWRADSRGESGPVCLEPDVRLAVHGSVHARRWHGGVLNAMDYNEVVETIAQAVDEPTAERDFAACRDAASRSDPGFTTFTALQDLGDEAFKTESMDLDGSTVIVFVRQRSTYLILEDRNTGDPVAVARAALATRAGRAG